MQRSAIAFVTLLAALLATAPAHAQYAWIDAKGLHQYSDQPPPPSVPLNRILKAPNPKAAQVQPQAAAPAPAAPAAATASLAMRNDDYNKRRAEQAEQEKKSADDSSAREEASRRCDELRSNKQMLDIGARIGVVNKQGERDIMDDQQRALASKRVQDGLAKCN